MKFIMLIIILTSQIFAQCVYEPVPFFGDIYWEDLIGLFQILLPYLFFVGFPLLLALVIYVIIKILKFFSLWTAGFAKDITSKD